MNLLSALRHLLSTSFSEDIEIFPEPYAETSSAISEASSPFDLPSVLVPPEVIEIDSMDLGGTMYEETKPANKREELPQYYLALFDNEVNLHILYSIVPPSHFSQTTPNTSTPAGYSLRSSLSDVVDIFEVNRKECARLLLEMPKWFTPGTFKPRPGTVPTSDVVPKLDLGWQLESTIIEVSPPFPANPELMDGFHRQSYPLCLSFPIPNINQFIIFH
jgi:nuclear cap-binding protein subunit 1